MFIQKTNGFKTWNPENHPNLDVVTFESSVGKHFFFFLFFCFVLQIYKSLCIVKLDLSVCHHFGCIFYPRARSVAFQYAP